MAGNTVKEMTTNFGKLNKFVGHDFRRWQKKMHFLLTTLRVVYVLTTPMTELFEDATVEAIRIKAKWENDDYICKGHILNEESLRAQDGDKGKGKEVGGPSVNMTEEGRTNITNKTKVKSDPMRTTVVLVPTRNQSWNVRNVVRLVTSKGIAEVVKRTTQMLVVRESGLRTNRKTKVDAIAWWIDSCVITHVCKDRCWFKTYKPVEDGSVLYMGDDHFAHVHGKGSVTLEFSSRKTITLFNVLYVSKLRHVHYKRMLEMSKDDLIHAIDENPKKCTTCDASRFCDVYLLHAKDEALDKFRIYKTEVKLQQNDLVKTLRTNRGGEYYDPVFFQSVGIIHETTAPYTPQQNSVAERKKELLRKWLPDPERKKLGEKGIDCIFVGYAENSKAYSFYIIEPNDSVSINSIIESRDAIFDENHFSSIPRPNDIIPDSNKPQRDDHFDDAPNEIPEPRKVARITTIRLLLALAPIHNLVIHQMDVKTAFLNGDLDKEVYMKQPEGFIMPGNERKVFDKTKKFLSSRFSMKDIGEADVILSIKIKRENKGIVITQSHDIQKILKKFNREDCSSVSTPMDPVEKLKLNTGKPMDQLEYSRAIGCLMYAMTSTRLDIAYVVEAYSDASWINHVEDSSSTSGWVFLLGGGAISWASKKQTCITGSTIESEFVALAAAGKEAEWLRNLIHDIPIWPKPIAPISIRCDSAPIMARAYSQIYNRKSRHLGVRHSMVRELIRNDVISIEFVRTQHNLADHLMKGLARNLVYKSVIRMGLKSI
uniref:Zinc finger, CCHC-type n=1 Tax=Tanacetum cinerariifolium TaxID=118510 RepID=A0A6L2N372_TANCI|nr:zinc finger, CCHC-type [Tanacetum cinerariifolium]